MSSRIATDLFEYRCSASTRRSPGKKSWKDRCSPLTSSGTFTAAPPAERLTSSSAFAHVLRHARSTGEGRTTVVHLQVRFHDRRESWKLQSHTKLRACRWYNQDCLKSCENREVLMPP